MVIDSTGTLTQFAHGFYIQLAKLEFEVLERQSVIICLLSLCG